MESCLSFVCCPRPVEVGKRLQSDHFRLGLAFLEKLLDAVARRDQHVAELNEVGPCRKGAVSRHDLGRVVGDLDIRFQGADHAANVAAVAVVDILISLEIIESVARAKHVCVGKIDPRVAIGMRVRDVG